MLTIENSFLVDKSAREIFGLFNQIDKLAWAFPTVSRVDVIDADHVNLGVVLKMGLLPLDNNLSLEITERTPSKRLVAEGIAIPGKGLAGAARIADKEASTRISMVLDLEELDGQKTRIRYTITADASGNLKRIYDAIIKGQRTKLESEFIHNVSDILGVPIFEERGCGSPD
ncbi:MAG: hypothetical protein HY644_00415 [Acidobacteria bacterium]|nr:hypothetical protein [Acidobacteriota bacterium]